MNSATLKRVVLPIAAGTVVVAIGSVAYWSWHTTRQYDHSAPSTVARARDLPEMAALEPQLVMPLTPEEAMAENETIPFAKGAVEEALPFGADQDPLAYGAALDCLTAAVYYEAAGEGERGQRAVAQVVLNRVRHPAFPARVCDVVYQGSERKTGCQFTFTCDGSLARRPSRAGWDRARRIAAEALAGTVEPSIGMATHYHANWVVPYWARNLAKITVVGAHIFYRWPGYWGRRQAFAQRYAGESLAQAPTLTGETDPLALGDGLVEFNPESTLPGGLPAQRTPPLRADEQERELIVDEAPGGLLVDEQRSSLVRESGDEPRT